MLPYQIRELPVEHPDFVIRKRRRLTMPLERVSEVSQLLLPRQVRRHRKRDVLADLVGFVRERIARLVGAMDHLGIEGLRPTDFRHGGKDAGRHVDRLRRRTNPITPREQVRRERPNGDWPHFTTFGYWIHDNSRNDVPPGRSTTCFGSLDTIPA